jgi:hypothetical protein
MRSYFSISASICVSTLLGACTIFPTPEAHTLSCDETKDTIYQIPTNRGPTPVDIQFKMACNADKKGVEVNIKNHPWGDVGKTMVNSVGEKAPRYEYIPCGGSKEADSILKSKWDEFESIEYFADRGRDIEDIRHVDIDMRFRQDYALRYYLLNSAKNMCFAIPQRDMK